LEYERKVEEEGRWRDYTLESESILRSARDEGVVEDGRRGRRYRAESRSEWHLCVVTIIPTII
jgi:hypothetical protein